MSSPLRILSRYDVRRALPMADAIGLMESAFVQLSSGEAVVPQRLSVEMPENGGRALIMPVYLPRIARFGVKLVSLFRENPGKDLPYIHALFLVMDGNDGRPLALLDAEYLTALRTGAASGLASRLLSKQDSSTLVLFGAGAQARSQLEGVCAVRPIRRAYVYDTNPERVEAFRRCTADHVNCNIIPASSPDVVSEADIVCTATTSRKPVFSDSSLRPGTHINAIGAYRQDMCELPAETVLRARVIVDHRASCLNEAGDLLQVIRDGRMRPEEIHAELGEVVSGKATGREDEQEITIFKSVGNAVQDLAAAHRVLVEAERQGLGSEVRL
jgi:ornithine cyclodeaminase/alanine dehydrogenase-like protein (mu-crystallin family)